MVRIFALGLFVAVGIFAETDTEKQTHPCEPHNAGYPACKVVREMLSRACAMKDSKYFPTHVSKHIIVGNRAGGEPYFIRDVAERINAHVLTIDVPTLCSPGARDVDQKIRDVFNHASLLAKGGEPVIVALAHFDTATKAPEHMSQNAYIVQRTIKELLGHEVKDSGLDPSLKVIITVKDLDTVDWSTRKAICTGYDFVQLPNTVSFEQFKAIINANGAGELCSEKTLQEAYVYAHGLAPDEINNLAQENFQKIDPWNSFLEQLVEAQARQAPIQSYIAAIRAMSVGDVAWRSMQIFVGGWAVKIVWDYVKQKRADQRGGRHA